MLGQAHQRVCCGRMCALHHRYAPQAAIHAPSTKQISGESNIVEMLLQSPALLQHATATGAATARYSDRCRSKYCDVSGTEHALYALAAQRALIRAQLPNSGSLATAKAKGVP